MHRLLLVLAAGLAAAQGLQVIPAGSKPKASAAEYPAHREAGDLEVGAEYMVHSFGSGEQMFVVEHFLVVEVALIPPKGGSVAPTADQFSLRVNGKATLLHPADPRAVAASLTRSAYQQQRGLSGGIGVGGIGIGMGGPQSGGPMPRSPTNTPRVPDSPSPAPGDRQDRRSAEEVLVEVALPMEPHRGAVAGFLYFPYEGKPKGVKSVELLYDQVTLILK